MEIDKLEGVMVTSLNNCSEDSGYDNGFMSDSSASSQGNLDSLRQVCIFSKPGDIKNDKSSKETKHECSMNIYNISGKCIEIISSRTFLYFSTCVVKLDLSNNNIKELPESICKLKNLEELNLSHNEFQSVSESWKVLHRLKTLNLSYNWFTVMPKCLENGMERLTHIDVSHNRIAKSDKPPLCLPFLECLNLSHNAFLSFPIWLFNDQCRSLLELDISFNFCFDDTTFSSQLIGLKHYRTSALKTIKKLNICNVGTNEKLISSLAFFESLEILYMGNAEALPEGSYCTSNRFPEISLTVFSNPSIVVELHLSKVGLAGLPNDFNKLSGLKVLDLSHNPLDWLPDCFGSLASLEELNLRDCNLSFLPENFGELNNLKKLVLTNNMLTEVREQLNPLASLKWLDLYDNCLETFPMPFERLCSLHGIDVAKNCFNLEVILDYKLHGENILDLYSNLQKNLRSSDPTYSIRCDIAKENGNYSDWGSSDSLHRYKESYKSEDTLSSCGGNDQVQCIPEDDEEDWDDLSSHGDDYFDPTLVNRYSLPPGQYRFGWTPPLRQRECVIPTSLLLQGFLYVPGATHTRTTRHKRVDINSLPTVEGQFDDFPVGDVADRQRAVTLKELLNRLKMFVRNPSGPGRVRKCRFCSDYDDCWHVGIWMIF